MNSADSWIAIPKHREHAMVVWNSVLRRRAFPSQCLSIAFYACPNDFTWLHHLQFRLLFLATGTRVNVLCEQAEAKRAMVTYDPKTNSVKLMPGSAGVSTALVFCPCVIPSQASGKLHLRMHIAKSRFQFSKGLEWIAPLRKTGARLGANSLGTRTS
eukprot:4637494-Amphidinium_carterae.1